MNSNTTNKLAKLTLVGAGPGDPELITIKGKKALEVADVVLFDALIHPEILDLINVHAEKIFVGKQMGVCQFPQEKINELIVEHALQNKHVVRLKGGDPFVFGRGHEEMEYAQAHGVPCVVIPGISSSISAPELHGIPLTRRGMNESFWVVTGSTKDHKLSADISVAASSTASVVILMGMHKLPQIVEIYKLQQKQDTPIGIFQNVTLPDEKYVLGNISNIQTLVETKGIGSPAIIVIGDVVTLHPHWGALKATN
jgi:uroporphyrin-III C-methyltransferase